MRIVVPAILAALALLPSPASATDSEQSAEPQPIGEEIEIRLLTNGAWVVTTRRPWPANTVVVRMADGTVVLADTPPTTAFTEDLLAWVEEELEPEAIVAVNGHYHVDGSGGNRLLRARGIEVWGSRRTAELVASDGEAMLERLRRDAAGTEDEGMWDDEVPTPPSATFAGERKVLRFGEQEVHLLHPGASHSPDLLAIYFPHLELLFGGCMIKAGSSLGYLGDADLESWPEAVRRLRELPVRWVVPGHGERFDPGLLEHTSGLLREHGDGG